MDTEQFKYAGVVHSPSGSHVVAFLLRRKSGETFTVLLDAKGAQNLCHDMQEQIDIANFRRNSQ